MGVCGILTHPKRLLVYHPSSRNIILTKDVTFDETRFFYHLRSEPKQVDEETRKEIPTPLS